MLDLVRLAVVGAMDLDDQTSLGAVEVGDIPPNQARCLTAAPVWHELTFGVLRLPAGRHRDALVRYVQQLAGSQLVVLPYDQRAAEWHGREQARLASTGCTPPFIRGQIAAIAAIRGLTLVTRNQADFSGFAGLRVVDWAT